MSMKRFIKILLIGFFLTTCAYSPKVINTTMPIREVSILGVIDGSYNKVEILKEMDEVNRFYENEVGIRFVITDWKFVNFDSYKSWKMALQLMDTFPCYKDNHDIVIAFSSWNAWEIFKSETLGAVLGRIDDVYRRFIVIKYFSSYTIAHELAHAFVFAYGHSDGGLLSPGLIKILPLIPPVGKVWSFLEEDKKEILKNKNRYFGCKRYKIITKSVNQPEIGEIFIN